MTVGELRAVLADPMAEDRHEVVIRCLEPCGADAVQAECPALGAALEMAGLRRVLVVEGWIVGVAG